METEFQEDQSQYTNACQPSVPIMHVVPWAKSHVQARNQSVWERTTQASILGA